MLDLLNSVTHPCAVAQVLTFLSIRQRPTFATIRFILLQEKGWFPWHIPKARNHVLVLIFDLRFAFIAHAAYSTISF